MRLTPKKWAVAVWAALVVIAGLRATTSDGEKIFFFSLLGGFFIVRLLSLIFAYALLWRSQPRPLMTPSLIAEKAGVDPASELMVTLLWSAVLAEGQVFWIDHLRDFSFIHLGGFLLATSLVIPIGAMPMRWFLRTSIGQRIGLWLAEKARPAAMVDMAIAAEKTRYAAVLLPLLLIGAFVVRLSQTNGLELAVAEENAQFRRLENIVNQVEELERAGSAIRARLDVAEAILRERQILPGFLSEVRRTMPARVELRELNVQPRNESSITVSAPRESDLTDWLNTFLTVNSHAGEAPAIIVSSTTLSTVGLRPALTVNFKLR